MTTPTRYRLGRKPNEGRPRIRLTSHLMASYTPPAAVDRYSAVPALSWGMDGNDEWGCCTCADGDHEDKSALVAASNPEVGSTTAEVLAIYSAVTGFDPNAGPPGQNPTDNGAEMHAVRDFWQKAGFTLGGQVHKILMFAELDVHNVSLVQWALDQCGAVGVGVNLPNSAMQQFDIGQPWDVVANDGGIDGGHAVALVGYDAVGPVFVTWGAVQRATWAWWNAYVEEAWLSLTADFVNAHSGDDPLGVTLFQLGQAFAQITGKPNPVPAPGPPQPTPIPGPTPSPTPPPDHDPADIALVATLGPWSREHHIGGNERAARAFQTWAVAKGFMMADGVWVHGDGADCWCGPTVSEVGIGHNTQADGMHEITQDGT